jgi:hypothetical protein
VSGSTPLLTKWFRTCGEAVKITKCNIFRNTLGWPIFALKRRLLRGDLNLNYLLFLVVTFREVDRVEGKL